MTPEPTDFDALRRQLAGDVHTDELSRRLVAQDASPYRVVPAALVRPRDADDCAALVTFARERGLSLIPRGGGTSLAGQCVGRGVVVDLSRYMHAVRTIDTERATVTAEPGLTVSQLNAAVAPHGLTFGPDPSTINRATLGGTVGNNAWGPHAPADGTTRDQVLAAEVILGDGSRATLGTAATAPAEADRERRQRLGELLQRHGPAVGAALPPAEAGLCSNTGYALHALDRDGALNEARLLAGAEGTLALATSLTLQLRPLRRDRRLLCPHFERLADALAAVQATRDAGACAIELLDAHLLGLTRDHPEQSANRFWLDGEPAAVLLIEFADGADPGALGERLRAAGAGAVPEVTGPDVERVWDLRRAGLGMLMGEVAPRRAVTGLEDTAVPLQHLPAYIEGMDALAAGEGTHFVRYGSVSLGLVQLRPFLDLTDADDQARYRRLLDGQAALVREYGGLWSTKHGDGRLRAPWIRSVLGEAAHCAMRETKALYDPFGLFNPGKILDAPDLLADRRTGGDDKHLAPSPLDWSHDRGLAGAAGRCNGAGACRKEASEGPMCPTWQATREERDSTRGRANLFQQALAADDPATAVAGDDLHAALSLCLACKACQYDCPAQVDMARLKSEHLYRRHQRRGMPRAARLAAEFVPLSALAAHAPGLANALGGLRPLQRIAGLDRAPPQLARESLGAWLARQPATAPGTRGTVVLLQDPHTAWYEPRIGRAAIAVLRALGWTVHVTGPVSSGRAALSQGALERARRELADLVVAAEDATKGTGGRAPVVIGLEPSELLTLRDEGPDLVPAEWRPRVEALAGRALLFEEWLGGEWDTEVGAGILAAVAEAGRSAGALAVHVHCHARALVGTEPARRALAALPGAEVEVIQAGCCGMAGAFGYGRETAATSRAVAELAVAPAVRALPEQTRVVAPGVSCRQQIAQVTGRTASHPAEIVARVLGSAHVT